MGHVEGGREGREETSGGNALVKMLYGKVWENALWIGNLSGVTNNAYMRSGADL